METHQQIADAIRKALDLRGWNWMQRFTRFSVGVLSRLADPDTLPTVSHARVRRVYQAALDAIKPTATAPTPVRARVSAKRKTHRPRSRKTA
jgi:hypothetical protein